MKVNNTEQNAALSMFDQKIIQESIKFNQIYDEEFVNLINNLNESIKEYYRVSKSNIIEASSFLSFYEQQGEEIQGLIEKITNSNTNENINKILNQFPKINDIMSQLKTNINSNENNLNLFFGDAKLLFKKMKNIRNQKMKEINDFNNNVLNDSFSKSSSAIHHRNSLKNKLIRENMIMAQKMKSPFNRINQKNKQNLNGSSFLMSINKLYSQIIKLLNNFSEFNYMFDRDNNEASNKYNNLQSNIKKEIDLLMNLVKTNFLNQNKYLNSIKNYNNDLDQQNFDKKNCNRSPIIFNNSNIEIEKFKKINEIYKKKIFELNNQIKIYQKNLTNINDSSKLNYETNTKIGELEIKNNQLYLQLIKAQQQIKEKDNIINEYNNKFPNSNNNVANNNDFNLNNLIKQRDDKISNLQQQLNVYQSNENLLNNQISELNKQFHAKMNQYKSKIIQINNANTSILQKIINKDKEILKLQNENNENKKEIESLQRIINMNNSSNISIQNKNLSQEEIIQLLKNKIINYQNMINKYENRIRELLKNNNNKFNNKKNNINYVDENAKDEQQFNSGDVQSKKIIEDLKLKINQLNKEIINYQKKEKAKEENNNKYIKQIEEMNNNILYTNKIIEQKDELIKQLNDRKGENISYINNNNINLELQKERDNYKFQYEQFQIKYKELLAQKNSIIEQNNNMLEIMKLEKQKLEKEISELKGVNNNNLNNNSSLLNKQIKELTLENKISKDSLLQTKESIIKLESDIQKKNDELEALRTVIFKLQSKLEKDDDDKVRQGGKKGDQKIFHSQINIKEEHNLSTTERKDKQSKINGVQNKSFDLPKEANTEMINNILNKLNDAEKKINNLQNKNKELQYKLEEKQIEKEFSGFRTEEVNYSNYEEEFDLRKMINGAREKNRSEDINIDYPGIQGLKDKYKELLQNMNMLEEQVKILICNINCNNKIKPQITQICQLMRIPAKNIQLIIAGKDKKKALGLIF